MSRRSPISINRRHVRVFTEAFYKQTYHLPRNRSQAGLNKPDSIYFIVNNETSFFDSLAATTKNFSEGHNFSNQGKIREILLQINFIVWYSNIERKCQFYLDKVIKGWTGYSIKIGNLILLNRPGYTHELQTIVNLQFRIVPCLHLFV